VTGPSIHASDAQARVEPGAVVLAVGCSGARDVEAALALAVDGHASAVVVRRGAELPTEPGICVLELDDQVSWSALHGQLASAVSVLSGSPDVVHVPLGDLDALANALASYLGGAVTIDDRDARVLAYSHVGQEIDQARQAVILNRRVPEAYLERLDAEGVYRRLWSGRDVVRWEAADLGVLPRLAVAVRSGEEILGSIWLATGEQVEDVEERLRRAAEVVAVHLLQARARDDLQRLARADTLLALLEGRVPARGTAALLHIDPEHPLDVVAFEVASDDPAAGDRAAGLVALSSEAYCRTAAVLALGSVAYVVLPVTQVRPATDVVGFSRSVCAQVSHALRCRVTAAVSRRAALVGDLPRARAEADALLRLLAIRGGDDVATADSLLSDVLLQRVYERVCDDPDLVDGRIRTLLEHDQRRGSDFVPTLAVYLDCVGDIARSAARLGVHQNTLRYRLRRVAELSGFDLDDPSDRLLVGLQVRFLQHRGSS
jgi:sugar diacid utilization regulator